MDALIQCIFVGIGTLGFCMIFHLERRHLLVPSLGGAICWGVYLLMRHFHMGIFLSTLIAAAFVGIYGEVMSNFERVPGSVYFIPGCVPLIPGSNLYYAMEAMIGNDWALFRYQLIKLVLFAAGISIGLGIVVELKHIYTELKVRIK